MATIDIRKEDKIIHASVYGMLRERDFKQTIAPTIDRMVAQNETPFYLLLDAQGFEGWENMSSFVNHMEFVRDHHQYIKKLAVVGIGKWREMVLQIVALLSGVEVKFFDTGKQIEAESWLKDTGQQETRKTA